MVDKKRKVLFIDDDSLLAEVNVLILRERGFDAQYTISLNSIQEKIKSFGPDIIILDVAVGADNSIGITPILKDSFPEIPIIFISSYIKGITIDNALRAGGDYYIKKPFDPDELLACINKLLPLLEKVAIGDHYSLEIKTRELFFDTTIVKRLSLKEYFLLIYFYENKNKTLSREMLIAKFWKDVDDADMSLSNFISKLRKLLYKDSNVRIDTIASYGYCLFVK